MNDEPRFHRWVRASFVTAQYEEFMPVTVQGLGRLDQDLFEQDELILAGGGAFAPEGDLGALSYHITLSYLWVLGAYEILRVINQRDMQSGHSDQEVLKVLRNFERLRMPLAKFEAARRHRHTDSKIAYPVLNSEHGVAWELADSVFISRGVLSGEFLALLESKRPAAD